MISIRSVLSLSCLLLLSGCAEAPHVGSPCPYPGEPSAAHKSCWYSLTITNIDSSKNLVTATDEQHNSFTFRVRDVDMLTHTDQLKKGETYVFSAVSNSPYLELYADQPKVKKQEKDAH